MWIIGGGWIWRGCVLAVSTLLIGGCLRLMEIWLLPRWGGTFNFGGAVVVISSTLAISGGAVVMVAKGVSEPSMRRIG